MLNEKQIKDEIEKGTMYKADKIKSILKLADQVTNDPQKESRMKQQLCVTCYYRIQIAGQRFTYRDCNICETKMEFSSTAVDKICQKCAINHSICKKCMAEI